MGRLYYSEIKQIPVPLWATAKRVHELTGVPQGVLADLESRLLVRSKKLGETKQATKLYCVADLLKYLKGRMP